MILLSPWGSSANCRAAPAFEILIVCPYSTLLPRARAATERRLAPRTGLAPLRGSLRAAPITFRCGWAGVPLSADKIIARQLAKAAFGWMGTARHLVGPSLCRSKSFRTGGLRASSASLFHFWLVRLMSFSRWICSFQAAREELKMSPQCIGHGNDLFIRSFERFF